MDVSIEDKAFIRDNFITINKEDLKEKSYAAWRPVPTTSSTIKIFIGIAIFYLGIGGFLFFSASKLI
jgi:hypothetical protein